MEAAARERSVVASCDDWLSVLQHRLREPLFHPEGVARLRRLARRLPGDMLTALEVRLASGIEPIDLSLRIEKPDQARRLAGLLSAPHLRSLLSRWAVREEPLSPVHSIWLELDLDREPEGLPLPVVCAKLLPHLPDGWLTGSLFPALHGRPLHPEQRRLVELCHESIPAPAYLLYAFSLLSRGGDTLRLEIFGLDPAGIVDYLGRVAPHTVPWIESTVGLFEGVERIHLSLDLGTEVLPRIGIEGSFRATPGREPRWRGLFDRLVERALCRPEERDAALAWPGSETFWTAPSVWPVHAGGGFCFRKLSHLKVICQPGHEPEAKVYLLFGHLPSRPPA